MKNIILISIGALLLVGASVAATVFIISSPSADAVAQEDGPAVQAEAGTRETSGPVRAVDGPPIYFELDPDFVVAFQNPSGPRFIKLAVEVMTRDDEVVDAMKLYKPAIRDRILMLISSKASGALVTPEGKEQFREEILTEVRKVLLDATGSPGVESAYFTSFVMQ